MQVSELRRDLRAALSTVPLTSYAQQLQRAQLLERAGDWQAAVEGYLSIGTGVTKDLDALQTVWKNRGLQTRDLLLSPRIANNIA